MFCKISPRSDTYTWQMKEQDLELRVCNSLFAICRRSSISQALDSYNCGSGYIIAYSMCPNWPMMTKPAYLIP